MQNHSFISEDEFGKKYYISAKYSCCQLCKYKNLPQQSNECKYCAENNKNCYYK